MKKTTKLMTAILATAAMISVPIASVFAADTVIFEDSFERGSAMDSNFLIAPPEVKVYGDNLYSLGNFESYTNDTGIRNSGWSVNSIGASVVYLGTDKYYNGSKSTKIQPSTTSTTNNYPILSVKQTFPEGLYEVEAWLYTDAENYDIALRPANNYQTVFSKLGNVCGRVKLPKGQWKKIRSIFSIQDTDIVTNDLAFSFKMYNEWEKNADGSQTIPLYIDDVKVRKIENAVRMKNADWTYGTSTGTTPAEGIGRYTMQGIIGENVTVTLPVNNELGEDDYNVSLISALYDSEGRLKKILNTKEEQIFAGTENYDIVSTFTVPADTLETDKLVNYVWQDTDNIMPHVKKYEYPYHPYKIVVNTDGTAADVRNQDIPGTQWKSTSYNTYGAQSYTATMFDQIYVDSGRTGRNCLYIPLPKAQQDAGGQGRVYREVTLEPGTYEWEFYAMCPQDYLQVEVYKMNGGSFTQNASNKVTTTKLSPVADKWAGDRIYTSVTSWGLVKVQFTITEADKYTLALTQGMNGYIEKSLASNIGDGAYIDDVKLTKIDVNE